MKKRITIRDIAETTGMSVATVSAVLGNKAHCYASEKTKEMIRKKAAELGYLPNLMARGLKTGKSYSVGLAGSAFQNEIKQREMIALAETLRLDGYSMPSIFYRGEEKRLLPTCDELLQRGCDGLIVSDLPQRSGGLELTPYLENTVVITHNSETAIPRNTIRYDYRPGIREAMKTLRDAGHRSFAMLAKLNPEVHDQRTESFPSIGIELGVETAVRFIPPEGPEIPPEWFQAYWRENRASALFFSNDLLALQAIGFCSAMGLRVPEDISIIGFDDINSIRYTLPPLSSIRQPVALAARNAVALLLNLIEGRKNEIKFICPAEFIPRGSSGAKFNR